MDISDLMPHDSSRPDFLSADTREGRYLFLDLDPPSLPGLVLVGAGREVCRPDYRNARPGFHYHAVEFVAGGTWKFSHPGGGELLHPGAVFAYGPGIAHSIEAVEGEELIKYFLNFTGGIAAKWIDDCGLSDCRARYVQGTRWLHDLFDQLLDGNRLNREEAREIGTRLAELILARIRFDSWPGGDGNSGASRTFSRCRAFIHDSYLRLNSVAEIASECHIDPAYLARLFQRFSDERPLRLLTRLKTQHAADLILRHGCSVAEAGQAVGFPDPFHFSRVFKRVHGISPGRAGFPSKP
jgi:AraC-like DNA-binding protein